jgi:hypothetical protein
VTSTPTIETTILGVSIQEAFVTVAAESGPGAVKTASAWVRHHAKTNRVGGLHQLQRQPEERGRNVQSPLLLARKGAARPHRPPNQPAHRRNTMTTTPETAAAGYELLQTFAYAEGGSASHRSTFAGSAAQARKERIERLRKQGRAYMLDGNSVIFDERNGDQVRLEWVQK